jgi:hypothetical protein
MHIIEFEEGKKRLEFVAGLVWHPLQSTGSAGAKEILRYAHAQDCDLKVVRQNSSPHVGLTKKKEGGKPGQLSVAAVVADSLAESGYRNCLVALVKPGDPNTYVFLALRDGVILADGDVVGSAEEVRARMIGDVSYGGWDCIICPLEWGINDSKQRTLLSFLEPVASGKLRQWALRETVLNWKKYAIAAALGLLLVACAFFGWTKYQHFKFLEAEALRQQQEELERNQKLAVVAGPPMPWLSLPGAVAFAQACTQAYQSADLNGGNWPLESVICANNTLTIRWSRASPGAWISHLQAMHPSAVFSDDAASATLSMPAIPVPPVDSATTPIPSKAVNLRYQDLASRFGFSVNAADSKTTAKAPQLPGQVSSEDGVPGAPWTSLPVSITSMLDPVTTIRLLNQPGLRLTRIDFLYAAGVLKYQLTGVQYVSLP